MGQCMERGLTEAIATKSTTATTLGPPRVYDAHASAGPAVSVDVTASAPSSPSASAARVEAPPAAANAKPTETSEGTHAPVSPTSDTVAVVAPTADSPLLTSSRAPLSPSSKAPQPPPSTTSPTTTAATAPTQAAQGTGDAACADGPTASTRRRLADADSFTHRWRQGSSHVWLLASWKNPHLLARPLLPLDVPFSDRRAGISAGDEATASPATAAVPAAFVGTALVGSEGVYTIARGTVFVRRPGECIHGDVKLTACEGVSFVFMAQLSGVQVEDCRNCFFFFGPTATAVTFTRCTDCVVVVLTNRLVFVESHGILCSAHTMHLPLLVSTSDIDMAAFSSWFNYNELPLHLRAAGLSPFINNYSTVIDRTPPGPHNGTSSAATAKTSSVPAETTTTTSHARSYHCIGIFALDALLYEWWVRVENAKHAHARERAAAATGEVTAEVSPTASTDAVGTDVQQCEERDAYAVARDAWKAELDALRPSHARHGASPLCGSAASLVGLSDVDVTAPPSPSPHTSLAIAETDASTKENEDVGQMAAAADGPRVLALRRLYTSRVLTPIEWKLRNHFLRSPVVFLSAVTCQPAGATDAATTTATPAPRSAKPASASTALTLGGARGAGLEKRHSSTAAAPATADLYFRLRALLRQRDSRVTPLQPPYTPRTLLDVRALFAHAVVVPATLGAQPIPSACLRQRWRLKLLVVTAKGGGWFIANRVLSDVERFRRTALMDAVTSADGSDGARGNATEAEGSSNNNNNVTNGEEKKRASDDTVSRYGPVILLNTAELRCSEIIVREYVAPTFYLLTEPLEAVRARQTQRQGHAAAGGSPRAASTGTATASKSSDGGGGFFDRAMRLVQRQIGGGKGNGDDRGSDDEDDLRNDQVRTGDADEGSVTAVPEQVNVATTQQPLHAHTHRHHPNTSSPSAESVSRHLVEMRRLFGDAIQRMSGQTCILLLALVAPTPLTATTTTSAFGSSTASRTREPVALAHGLPSDPADIFQPLTCARERVLELVTDGFERQQSLVRPLLPPPQRPPLTGALSSTPRTSSGSAHLASSLPASTAMGGKRMTTAGVEEREDEDEDGNPLLSEETLASCREDSPSSSTLMRYRRATHLQDVDGTAEAMATVPESRVRPVRLAAGAGGGGPASATATAAESRKRHALASAPVPECAPGAQSSAEEQVWSRAVILNVSLPIRFVNVLQANLFFKGCISSHQIASVRSSVDVSADARARSV